MSKFIQMEKVYNGSNRRALELVLPQATSVHFLHETFIVNRVGTTVYWLALKVNDVTKEWAKDSFLKDAMEYEDGGGLFNPFYKLTLNISISNVLANKDILDQLMALKGTAFRDIDNLDSYKDWIGEILPYEVTGRMDNTCVKLYDIYGGGCIQFVNKNFTTITFDSFDNMIKQTIANYRYEVLATISKYTHFYNGVFSNLHHGITVTTTVTQDKLHPHPTFIHKYTFDAYGKTRTLEVRFYGTNLGYFGAILVDNIITEYLSLYGFYWRLSKALTELFTDIYGTSPTKGK